MALLWCALVAVLWAQQRRAGRSVDWRAAMRLVPDVVRLLRALIADRTVPRVVRWSLVGLLAYLLLPVDLIPDVIPVLGVADDVLLVAVVLRFAVRRAGVATISRHWFGTDEGLHSVLTLTGAGTGSETGRSEHLPPS
ncbi:YkvA family protein [Rathayibacter sp. VKM Ac-2835]|uniref:YkvA family protein n=1 Tax=Rathayibacter sp. VKM Ac-2835 TaxID=2739043 RepID=UPI00349F1B86